MLCTVAIQSMRTEEGKVLCTLRVTGKTALGPSGTGGQDVREALSPEDVRATLQRLGLNEDAWTAATAILHDPQASSRFMPVVEDVQIPFDVLESSGFYLFD